MTHFAVLVLTRERDRIEESVSTLLAPYDEDGEWGRDGSRYDWWEIGGRQTGMLDATYDPTKDPANIEGCDLCGGTGDRAAWRGESREGQHPSGCNGCDGTGQTVKWPGRWASFEGDVKPVADVDFDRLRYLPTAVVTPDGKWHEKVDGGFGMFAFPRGPELPADRWGQTVSRLLDDHRDAVAVVVDCHV